MKAKPPQRYCVCGYPLKGAAEHCSSAVCEAWRRGSTARRLIRDRVVARH